MRRISVMSLAIAALAITPLHSDAGLIWKSRSSASPPSGCTRHSSIGREIDRLVNVYFADTYVEFKNVDNPTWPRTSWWENLGDRGTAYAWNGRMDFRVHTGGAIVDSVYFWYDDVLTIVGVRRPRQPMRLSWPLTNIGDNAPRNMHVHVVMHLEGEPMRLWEADIDVYNQNVQELRERGR